MASCGERVYRGSWYLGPCLKEHGHEGGHDPTKQEPLSGYAIEWAEAQCRQCGETIAFAVPVGEGSATAQSAAALRAHISARHGLQGPDGR